MPARLPRKRIGNDWRDIEWNALIDYLQSVQPRNSNGTRTSHTVHGIIREAEKKRGGNGSVGDFPVWL